MFSRILVPLDGSPMSEVAVGAAETLAHTFDSELILLYVNEPNPPRTVHGERHLQDPGEAERYLHSLVDAIRKRGVTAAWHVHEPRERNVAAGIALHVQELAPDLTVVCSHGSTGSTRLFTGSVAQRIAGSSNAPVFIINSDWKKPEGSAPLWESVLVPLDGQEAHEAGLSIGRDLARRCSASLRLLLIVPTLGTTEGRFAAVRRYLPAATKRMLELEVGIGERYIAGKAEELRNEGVEASWQVLRGDPPRQIVQVTKDSHCDLVVLATHGNEGFDAFWTGSVAHRICSFTPVPVLLVRIVPEPE
jgi:nucleotide-binding universal stress UspA family protein